MKKKRRLNDRKKPISMNAYKMAKAANEKQEEVERRREAMMVDI